jgi:hypothetical protein
MVYFVPGYRGPVVIGRYGATSALGRCSGEALIVIAESRDCITSYEDVRLSLQCNYRDVRGKLGVEANISSSISMQARTSSLSRLIMDVRAGMLVCRQVPESFSRLRVTSTESTG